MNTEVRDFISLLKFLSYLRKYFVVIFLSAGLIIFIAYNRFDTSTKYPASVRFIINNPPGTNVPEVEGVNADLREMKSNSMQLFFSTEVLDELMKKYDLYGCYRIRRNDLFSRENLLRAVRGSIQFKLEKMGGYELIVTTRDRNMSAVIANSLIDETDKLNRKLLSEELMRKAEIMNTLILHSSENALQNINKDIESLIQLSKAMEQQKVKSSGQENLETRLSSVLTQLQQNTESMSRTRDYYNVVLKNYESGNFHFFYIIAKAIPDHKNYAKRNFTMASAAGIFITLLAVMAIYYIRRQLEQVRELGLYPVEKKISRPKEVTAMPREKIAEALSFETKVT